MAIHNKTPIERKFYTIDYSRWLADSETLTDIQIAVSPATTPVLEVPSAYTDVSGKLAILLVTGGVQGQQYKVRCIASTTEAQVKEHPLLINVVAP